MTVIDRPEPHALVLVRGSNQTEISDNVEGCWVCDGVGQAEERPAPGASVPDLDASCYVCRQDLVAPEGFHAADSHV